MSAKLRIPSGCSVTVFSWTDSPADFFFVLVVILLASLLFLMLLFFDFILDSTLRRELLSATLISWQFGCSAARSLLHVDSGLLHAPLKLKSNDSEKACHVVNYY
jgi:hypothetical protein